MTCSLLICLILNDKTIIISCNADLSSWTRWPREQLPLLVGNDPWCHQMLAKSSTNSMQTNGRGCIECFLTTSLRVAFFNFNCFHKLHCCLICPTFLSEHFLTLRFSISLSSPPPSWTPSEKLEVLWAYWSNYIPHVIHWLDGVQF